ncbi:Hypothetical predicted protein [Paramuricea clavata]|uniref:Uncharacterized protein n=1 Tax=Paramuricea clavata TaxID=317549 RepID=A0A7D9I6L3_PARCT|nr:Hypothetical predicted protein [Paramuricea clavata]
MDFEVVMIEVQNSHEEVEGNKQFPCDFCEKICKSKGGLTKHQYPSETLYYKLKERRAKNTV